MTCNACYRVKHNFQQYNVRQNYLDIRDICKFRKRQHQYPEFGHTQGEIKKKPAEKYISIQGVGGGETQKTMNFDGS
jgi:hypothetical protein